MTSPHPSPRGRRRPDELLHRVRRRPVKHRHPGAIPRQRRPSTRRARTMRRRVSTRSFRWNMRGPRTRTTARKGNTVPSAAECARLLGVSASAEEEGAWHHGEGGSLEREAGVGSSCSRSGIIGSQVRGSLARGARTVSVLRQGAEQHPQPSRYSPGVRPVHRLNARLKTQMSE